MAASLGERLGFADGFRDAVNGRPRPVSAADTPEYRAGYEAGVADYQGVRLVAAMTSPRLVVVSSTLIAIDSAFDAVRIDLDVAQQVRLSKQLAQQARHAASKFAARAGLSQADALTALTVGVGPDDLPAG